MSYPKGKKLVKRIEEFVMWLVLVAVTVAIGMDIYQMQYISAFVKFVSFATGAYVGAFGTRDAEGVWHWGDSATDILKKEDKQSH